MHLQLLSQNPTVLHSRYPDIFNVVGGDVFPLSVLATKLRTGVTFVVSWLSLCESLVPNRNRAYFQVDFPFNSF